MTQPHPDPAPQQGLSAEREARIRDYVRVEGSAPSEPMRNLGALAVLLAEIGELDYGLRVYGWTSPDA